MNHRERNFQHEPEKGRRFFLRRFGAALCGLPFIGHLFGSRASAAGTGLLKRLAAAPHASANPFIGEIAAVGFNFAPRGWATCDGQLLSIASNSALFSILGTTYGGDGRTTFGLPDLRGRIPLHPGSGPGLSTRNLGQRAGTETHTLSVAEMPTHNHNVPVLSDTGQVDTPAGNNLAADASGALSKHGSSNVNMHSGMIQNAGGGYYAHNNMQPFLVLNYVIALTGVYPSRS